MEGRDLICSEHGCAHTVHSRSVCSTHYAKHRRESTLDTLPKGRSRETGDRRQAVQPKRRLWAAPECLADGCSDPAQARNLCPTHYQRARADGSLENYPKVRHALVADVCGVEGCAAPAKSKAMCQRHYQLSRRYGYAMSELDSLPTSCEVCGSTLRLHQDHDHGTGDVRGTLCGACNTALGLVSESVETLAGLIAYVVRHR